MRPIAHGDRQIQGIEGDAPQGSGMKQKFGAAVWACSATPAASSVSTIEVFSIARHEHSPKAVMVRAISPESCTSIGRSSTLRRRLRLDYTKLVHSLRRISKDC
jgi:hypothetical protein